MERQLGKLERELDHNMRRVVRGGQRAALTRASRITLNAMKALAPTPKSGSSGLLKKSLGLKAKTNTRTDSVYVIVGPRRGMGGFFQRPGRRKRELRVPGRYAHLVEGGRNSPIWGPVMPRPFINPAYESTKSQVLAKYKSLLAEETMKAAARIRRKMMRR